MSVLFRLYPADRRARYSENLGASGVEKRVQFGGTQSQIIMAAMVIIPTKMAASFS